MLGGTPLLGSAQAGVFHPSTWAGIVLPVALSWTFSCTFTLFLALLCGYLFFRDFGLSSVSAVLGATAWGFSTYIVFWDGWSIGPATASFPLLLLGLRRIARGGRNGVALSVAGFLLGFFGGHPETTAQTTLVAVIYFGWELAGRRRQIGAALGRAAGAAVLAFLLGAPQLLPMAEVIPQSAEYRSRASAPAASRTGQSVAAPDAASRLLPAALPFAHGIYGRSPVQAGRADGSGMPLAYAGALLFPLAGLALFSRRHRERGRTFFTGAVVAGLLLGASAPVLTDFVTSLPGFSLMLAYRCVLLAALGIAGLAAFGAEEVRAGARTLPACAIAAVSSALLFLASKPVFRDRELPARFVNASLAFEIVPVLLLAGTAFLFARRHPARTVAAALALLVLQRFAEMHGMYPTLPRDALAPPFPGLEAVASAEPFRVVARSQNFRPNAAALYGVEDVRGYESIMLARFAETFPRWSVPQFASFNRVDDLGSRFLSFLNARFAIDEPGAHPPPGWVERTHTRAAKIFEKTSVLPRAFAPDRVRPLPPSKVLRDMAAGDFGRVARIDSARAEPEIANPHAEVRVRESGPDLAIEVQSPAPVLIATSIPDWPGWTARAGGRELPMVTVNNAFVGFRAPAGSTSVRLFYAPRSWSLAMEALAAGLIVCAVAALRMRSADRRL